MVKHGSADYDAPARPVVPDEALRHYLFFLFFLLYLSFFLSFAIPTPPSGEPTPLRRAWKTRRDGVQQIASIGHQSERAAP